jgi:hypothetical protein
MKILDMTKNENSDLKVTVDHPIETPLYIGFPQLAYYRNRVI